RPPVAGHPSGMERHGGSCAERSQPEATSRRMDGPRRKERPAHRASWPHAGRNADVATDLPRRGVVTCGFMPTPEEIEELLEAVKDPEIPVISIRELGVLREVTVEDGTVNVTITPTYSGCPALAVMRQEVEEALRHAGIERFTVKQS